MSKHTPSPWLYRGKSDSVHMPCDTHPYGDQIFRFVEDAAPSDEDLALILAAPDLLAELKSLYRAYVRLLEAGHDRILSLGGDCDAVDRMEQDDPHLRAAKAVIEKATA